MKYLGIFLQVMLVIMITEKVGAALAPSIRPCPQNHQKYADCVINAIDALKPQISTGVYGPNLITEANLTKLILGDVSVNRNFNLKMTDLYALGLKNFKIEKLRINLEKFRIDVIMTFPRIEGSAKYSLVWNLGVFAIQGGGDLSIAMENAKVLLKFFGSRYLRNGVEYLKIDTVQITIHSAQLRVYFDNLFKGQKALEKAANEVINQNIATIKADVLPIIEQRVAKTAEKISNEIFASAPYNEFFPLN